MVMKISGLFSVENRPFIKALTNQINNKNQTNTIKSIQTHDRTIIGMERFQQMNRKQEKSISPHQIQ